MGFYEDFERCILDGVIERYVKSYVSFAYKSDSATTANAVITLGGSVLIVNTVFIYIDWECRTDLDESAGSCKSDQQKGIQQGTIERCGGEAVVKSKLTRFASLTFVTDSDIYDRLVFL